MKIKKWIRSQELPETETTEELIEEAGSALDAACPHDICGETIFVGEDGQVYVGTVEFNLNPIHPDYLKEIEKEDGNEYGRKDTGHDTGRTVPVHIARVSHSEGTETFADTSEAGLEKQIAGYCRGRWDEAVQNMKGQKPTPPENDQEALAAYFAAVETSDFPETLEPTVCIHVRLPG